MVVLGVVGGGGGIHSENFHHLQRAAHGIIARGHGLSRPPLKAKVGGGFVRAAVPDRFFSLPPGLLGRGIFSQSSRAARVGSGGTGDVQRARVQRPAFI